MTKGKAKRVTDVDTRDPRRTRAGQCVRGPFDGEPLAHYASEFRIVRPVLSFHLDSTLSNIEEALVGTYIWTNDSYWLWHPA